ncbi:MAG: M15 family metallopeptidase [Clostridia bacterium]|nr:M15 family metallopeptidase [Clostridia bacterium]
MKKVIIAILTILLIIAVFISCRNNDIDTTTTTAATTTAPTTTVPSTTVTTTEAPTTTTTVTTTTSSSSSTIILPSIPVINTENIEWYLILANGENKLPDDYVITTTPIKYGLGTYPFSLDERVAAIWEQMCEDAHADGVTNWMWVISAYRSVELQEESFTNSVKSFLNQGYSMDDAIALTSKSYMYPGCSDHNLGLAVDIGTTNTSFEDSEAFAWLKEHAEDYGFVLRYPKDKVEITKVKYEPWHWRYVGVEAAKEMNELGMCLEEYHVYKGFVQH